MNDAQKKGYLATEADGYPIYEVTVTDCRAGWRMRWRKMWLLEIAGEGMTQSFANFYDAEAMVRDYINCVHDDHRGHYAKVFYRWNWTGLLPDED